MKKSKGRGDFPLFTKNNSLASVDTSDDRATRAGSRRVGLVGSRRHLLGRLLERGRGDEHKDADGHMYSSDDGKDQTDEPVPREIARFQDAIGAEVVVAVGATSSHDDEGEEGKTRADTRKDHRNDQRQSERDGARLLDGIVVPGDKQPESHSGADKQKVDAPELSEAIRKRTADGRLVGLAKRQKGQKQK